jgi:hypothetical protein
MCYFLCGSEPDLLNFVLKGSLVELERPTAYHSTPVFPPHTFRYCILLISEPHYDFDSLVEQEILLGLNLILHLLLPRNPSHQRLMNRKALKQKEWSTRHFNNIINRRILT